MNIRDAIPGEPLPLGRRWEHHATRMIFDISAWVDAFGAGTVRLLHQRQGDDAPYPVAITRTDADGTPNDETGTLVLWDVTRTDTAKVCHYGRAELRYYSGAEGAEEFLAKSEIYRTVVADALGASTADAPPEQREWLDTLLEAAEGIEENVAAAQAAQARTEAVATRINNQIFYIDRDPESDTYGNLMWVHDANTDYDPEAPRIIAYGGEWRLDENGVLTITHDGALNALPDLGDYGAALRRVVLEGVTSIGGYVFDGCSALTSVTIPDSVTSIGSYAFRNCSSLASLTIPDSVTSVGENAFRNCSSLASVAIPDSVTNMGIYAFANCTALASVAIGDGLTAIEIYAFYRCTALASVAIGDGVTAIGERAFFNCSSLASVAIPDSVTSVGDYAFTYCSALTDVSYKGSEERRNSIDCGWGNEPLTSATWHYHWEG